MYLYVYKSSIRLDYVNVGIIILHVFAGLVHHCEDCLHLFDIVNGVGG